MYLEQSTLDPNNYHPKTTKMSPLNFFFFFVMKVVSMLFLGDNCSDLVYSALDTWIFGSCVRFICRSLILDGENACFGAKALKSNKFSRLYFFF